MKSIIVIDMQKGFINKNNQHIVNSINEYLNNNEFKNVFYTKFLNNENSPFVKILKWNSMLNKDEQELVVSVKNNAIIFEKSTYSLNIDNLNAIKSLNIKEIEVCGTDTEACVLIIASQLFDNNIKPIILSNLCASSSSNKNIHNNALEIMARSFGKDCIN